MLLVGTPHGGDILRVAQRVVAMRVLQADTSRTGYTWQQLQTIA